MGKIMWALTSFDQFIISKFKGDNPNNQTDIVS